MIARALMVMFLLLAGYSGLLALYPSDIPIVGHSYQVNNLVRAERVAFGGGTLSNLIVGSSLSGAISHRQLPPGFVSLAFDADGPLSGLEVLSATGRTPLRLFVEMNVADGRRDNANVSHVSKFPWAWLRRFVPLFRTSNQPLNLLRSWVGSRMGLTQKISNPVRVAEGLEHFRRTFGQEPDVGLLRQNLARMADVLGQLRQRGCAVVLVEFPIHPELRIAVRQRVMMEECLKVFPEPEFRWVRPAAGVEYQTTDGHHLDTPSGDRFVRLLAEEAFGPEGDGANSK